jgi:hypothetical protein
MRNTGGWGMSLIIFALAIIVDFALGGRDYVEQAETEES